MGFRTLQIVGKEINIKSLLFYFFKHWIIVLVIFWEMTAKNVLWPKLKETKQNKHRRH